MPERTFKIQTALIQNYNFEIGVSKESITRSKATSLEKHPRFAANLRRNPERVDAAIFIIREPQRIAAERKQNAEPPQGNPAAANIWLSFKSRKKVLSLSKLFS